MKKIISMNALREEANDMFVGEETVALADGTVVTVMPILSMSDKVALIEEIVIACGYDEVPYLNPLKLKVMTTLKVIDMCTDIDVFEDEEVDVYELYDALSATGILDRVLPVTEYSNVLNDAFEAAEALVKYRNSFTGILEELKTSQEGMEEMPNQLQGLIEQLQGSPEIIDILNTYKNEIAD